MTTDIAPEQVTPAVDAAEETRPRVRLVAVGVWVALLVVMITARGLPNDYFSIFSWLWLLAIAWRIEARPVTHLLFLRDWGIPLVLLMTYFYSREVADNLGMPILYTPPVDIDVWLGGGDTPTALLQSAWCGSPCDITSNPHWYDRMFILLWMSHFTVGFSVAILFWLRNRWEFQRWMRRYLGITFAALVCYVLIPTAPPWMASRDGYLPTEIHRLTTRAWVGPRPEGVGGADPASWVGNSVAAMPSLHAGVACLIAFYAIQRLRTPWRFVLLAYPVLMGTALVYLGEHYVADLLAGGLLALVVLVAANRWEAWRERRRATDRPAALAPVG